jgi:hypothetical protein
MKITDDILKAIQRTVDGFGSITEFAETANVGSDTLANFLSQKTKSIREDSWEKIYPFIKPYLPASADAKAYLKGSLTSDQKILLDAFEELPKKLKEAKLIEIVELARVELVKKS